MATNTDGKYVSLDELKLYGLGAIADPTNPTIYNSAVQGTPDDSILTQCIHRAEMEFDRIAGIQFDAQTVSDVQAFLPFVDGNGWLHLYAREHAPVTAVTSVSTRVLANGATAGWTDVSFTADNVILPVNDGYAHPECAHVMIAPSTAMSPIGTSLIMAKWTYDGGFSTIPQSMKAVVSRLAWWIYKIREAPVNKIVMAGLGVMEVPLKIPPDINADLLLWQPGYN